MNLEDKGELFTTVSVPTDVSAADLAARVSKQTSAGKMSAGEACDLLYPFLFEGSVYDRRTIFATLKRVGTPDAILATALRTYRIQGYEGYLNEAASLLAGFGAAAWPAIRKWAMLLCPICGNKRCPHATNHELDCTNSNEPGQLGSMFERAMVKTG